ncbi:hypothetical protein CALVIDRAFT_597490 [Calocera viscosa TUFC12733]|uniref:DUF1772-domain-containing protein n=1 Tax=Calocera viscosa (strain TUFC12733) TaxID=1330018 RepID=A0A167NCU3_CALVF|nr:hypothetical protein CALVIDRAFT_597490 [Calocera viscosa TUFC12733]
MAALTCTTVGTALAGALAGSELLVTICLMPSINALPATAANTSAKLSIWAGVYNRALPLLPPLTIAASVLYGAGWYYGAGQLAAVAGVTCFSVGIYTVLSVAALNEKLLALEKKKGDLENLEVNEAEKLFKIWSGRNWVRVFLSIAATALGAQVIMQLV